VNSVNIKILINKSKVIIKKVGNKKLIFENKRLHDADKVAQPIHIKRIQSFMTPSFPQVIGYIEQNLKSKISPEI